MSASRIQIPLVVQSVQPIEGAKGETYEIVVPVNKAKVKITKRDGKEVFPVWISESGAEIGHTVETGATGQIEAWVEEGPYLLTAEGGEPSISPTAYNFDAVTGRGVEHLAEEVVALKDLVATLQTFFVPVGAILNVLKEASTPTGFLTCNGTFVKKTVYPILWGQLGTTYGEEVGGERKLPNGEGENTAKQKFKQIVRHD